MRLYIGLIQELHGWIGRSPLVGLHYRLGGPEPAECVLFPVLDTSRFIYLVASPPIQVETILRLFDILRVSLVAMPPGPVRFLLELTAAADLCYP